MPHQAHLTSSAAVGQDAAGAHVLEAAEDLGALRLVGQVLDIGALGEEAAVEHEERVGGLVHAGSGGAERVTWAADAASCKLFGWRQSLCHAKGGAAAALLLHGVEKERSGSAVGSAAER